MPDSKRRGEIAPNNAPVLAMDTNESKSVAVEPSHVASHEVQSDVPTAVLVETAQSAVAEEKTRKKGTPFNPAPRASNWRRTSR